jgi:hypothetical protein
MKENIAFDIIVRRKVPYVTNFLVKLSILFIIILFLIAPIFLPSRNQSSEMQVAYYILVIPDYIKKLLAFAAIGLLLTFVLEAVMHLHKKALLTFNPDNILINGKKIYINIPISSIYRVYCMDLKLFNGQSRDKLKIEIQDKDKKTTDIRLLYYLQADKFMNNLISYQSIDIKFYDFDVSDDLNKES